MHTVILFSGYELFDDCGMSWYAAQGIQDLYGCHPTTTRAGCLNSNQEMCADIGISFR